MHKLAAIADVVIENFPLVAQKLGIDYESLSAINPNIVLRLEHCIRRGGRPYV